MQRDASAIMFHTETKGEKLCDHVEGLVVAGYCLRLSVELRWNENWYDLNMQTCVHACPT